MADFYKLAKSIAGQVPGTSLDLVMGKMREALGEIYDQVDWSFQRGITYANWLVPGLVASKGNFTVTPYQNTVTANSAATAAIWSYLNTPGAVFLTQLQYRDPQYSIYNVVGQGNTDTLGYLQVLTPGSGQTPGEYTVNGTGGTGTGAVAKIFVGWNGEVNEPPFILDGGSGYTENDGLTFTLNAGGTPATFQPYLNLVLTLDRPWLEPTSGPGQDYMLYQAYFVAPVKDFRKFIEVRDTTDGFPLDFWSMTQAQLAERDAQRLIFSDPTCVVAAGVDTRPGTSTPGWQMFELWPQQLDYEPYSFSYRRRGLIPEEQIEFMSFEPPYPITSELVEYKTRELLYEFKEAQRDKTEARGSGSNWLLLAQMAEKRYAVVLDKIIAIDLNLNNEALSVTSRKRTDISGEPWANRRGGLNLGSY